MNRALFIDTWGWVVLADRKDTAHHSVRHAYTAAQTAGAPIITTDYVLDETITLLFARAPRTAALKYCDGVMDSIAHQFVQLEHITPDRFAAAWRLRHKYADHARLSFTDCTSFVVMRELHITRALTQDRHFAQVNLGFERIP